MSVPELNSSDELAQLKRAIDTNDLAQVQSLMTRNPALHRAPLGYGKDGPLSWVAECRIPWEAPGQVRLAMAKWMIENGSDVHQGGDGPLGRAALNEVRVPMIDLLVEHGADVNAAWHGAFPAIFSPCEPSIQSRFVACSAMEPTPIAATRPVGRRGAAHTQAPRSTT